MGVGWIESVESGPKGQLLGMNDKRVKGRGGVHHLHSWELPGDKKGKWGSSGGGGKGRGGGEGGGGGLDFLSILGESVRLPPSA